MTEPALNDLAQISHELEKVASLVQAATRLVNDGRVIDLKALQDRTAILCDAAVTLPAAESKTLLEPMTDLIQHLDRLTVTLTDKYGGLPDLQTEAQPDTAASAYARSLDAEG